MDFSFNLPFCLLLPDGDYPVRVDNDVVVLHLEERIPESYDEKMEIRGLIKQDLIGVSSVRILITDSKYSCPKGQIVPVEKIWEIKERAEVLQFITDTAKQDGPAPRKPIFLNCEIPKDGFGRFRYTRLTAIYEQKIKQDTLYEAVNKLIDHYRVLTGEHWVRRITKSDILAYSHKDGSGGYGPIIKRRPVLDSKSVEVMKELLVSEKTPHIHELLLYDAEEALESGNHALSIIYSMTSLESFVKTFVVELASLKKLNSKRSKKLRASHLHYLVTVVLPLFIDQSILDDELIEAFEKANSLRNDIIHDTKFNVNQDQAEKALMTSLRMESALRKAAAKFYPEMELP